MVASRRSAAPVEVTLRAVVVLCRSKVSLWETEPELELKTRPVVLRKPSQEERRNINPSAGTPGKCSFYFSFEKTSLSGCFFG